MIVDIYPVAHVLAVPVYRQRIPIHGVRDHQRNKFFGKLSRSVVISAARNNRVDTEGLSRSADDELSRSLRGSVRRIRLQRRSLSKKFTAVFRKTSHHLIR